MREIPGPAGGGLLGDGLDFRRDMLGLLTRGMHQYGDVVAYHLGPPHTPVRTRLVIAHHPELVQQVLARTERSYTKDSVAIRNLAEMLGHGLLTTTGDEWKRQRRLVQPLFTPRRVEGYTALMTTEAARVVDTAPGHGQPVDLHLLMMRYALRVVGRALFGDDVEDTVETLDALVPRASYVIRRRMFRPLQIPIRYPTPGNLRAARLRDRQYAVVDDILGRSPRPGEPGFDPDRDDLVTRLRLARDPETEAPLDEAEIRDQALIFLMAGHETTAGALTFTLHLLGRHPEIQDRVATEIREVLGDDEQPLPGRYHELVWTRAALAEAMRLFPSAHTTDRCTAEPVELGGYRLPAGQIVLVSPWTTHRHPAIWPDPERFDPSRFIGAPDRPRYAYFPFGGGPRSCVGEHFALLEATVLLAHLLRQRRVVSLHAEIPVTPQVTLRPVGAVPATLTARP